MPLNLANSRLHGVVRWKKQQAWAMEAVAREPGLRGRIVPMGRARVSAVFYLGSGRTARANDDDNAVARLKWIFDLLKNRGLIVDDRRPLLELVGPPEQRLGTPRRVEVTLEEVA